MRGELYVHIVNSQQQQKRARRKEVKFAATVMQYVNKVHATAGASKECVSTRHGYQR